MAVGRARHRGEVGADRGRGHRPDRLLRARARRRRPTPGDPLRQAAQPRRGHAPAAARRVPQRGAVLPRSGAHGRRARAALPVRGARGAGGRVHPDPGRRDPAGPGRPARRAHRGPGPRLRGQPRRPARPAVVRRDAAGHRGAVRPDRRGQRHAAGARRAGAGGLPRRARGPARRRGAADPLRNRRSDRRLGQRAQRPVRPAPCRLSRGQHAHRPRRRPAVPGVRLADPHRGPARA